MRLAHYGLNLARAGSEIVRDVVNRSLRRPSGNQDPPVLDGRLPWVGHMVEFSRNPFALLMRARADGGEVIEFQLLNQPVVMLTGPEANEAFFRAPDDQLCRREAYKVMTPIFGKGVVFDAPLPRMNRQLNMVMPMLRDQVMRTYPPIIAQETERLIERWGSEGEVDLLAFMTELTIYTSTRCLIGEEFRSGITEEFFEIFHHLELGIHPLAYLWPYAPTPKFRRRDAARARLQRLIERLMEKRLRNPTPPRDGLQLMIESTYEDGSRLTPNELTGILVALIMAGHHTSAGTATWILIELLRNAQYYGRVRDEIDDVTWDADSLTYPMLREMSDLNAVVTETLRLHPPLIFLFRKVLRDFEYGGYVVKAGKMLCATPAVSHRIPEVFPDPERFNPDRYARAEQRHRTAWISFGGGKHKCTGNAFGTLQLKAITATLLSKYDFELISAPSDYHDNYKTATVQPEGPCMLRYRLRDRSAQRRPTRRGRKKGSRKVAEGNLRVTIDHHLCQGHAVCVSEASDVFRVSEESVAELKLDPQQSRLQRQGDRLVFYPPRGLNDKVCAAAEHCPNRAISVEEVTEEPVN
jgi:sterol 14-demethylase